MPLKSILAFLGWGEWSEWSSCNIDDEKVRTRKCLVTNSNPKMCQGSDREIRKCHVEMSNGKYWTLSMIFLWNKCYVYFSRNSSRLDSRNFFGNGNRFRSYSSHHHFLCWICFHYHTSYEQEDKGNESYTGITMLWILPESVLFAADKRRKFFFLCLSRSWA